MYKLFFSIFPFVFVISQLFSQETAIAIPTNPLTIDGSFKDWPEEVNWYNLVNHYGDANQSNEDFSAQFSAAYNEEEQAIYIALKVIDDYLIEDDGSENSPGDNILLYIDPTHDRKGGAPLYYTATSKLLEVNHKQEAFDGRNLFMTLEQAQVQRKRAGNITQYEWRLEIKDKIRANNVIGLDFMINDFDGKSENDAILLWKGLFAKSIASERLGQLLLSDKNPKVGKLEGKIDMSTIPTNERIDNIDIVSIDNPSLWLRASIDSNGYFQKYLPEGNYQLKPTRFFTSPIYSAGFKQNTRKLKYIGSSKFKISNNGITKSEDLTLKIIDVPQFEKKENSTLPIETLTVKEIDNFVNAYKEYYKIPAVSVVVIRDNQVVYDQTIGIKHNLSNDAVDNYSLFEAASITKSIFAVLVLRLAEQGIIDLDKPLYQYLAFPNIENDERSKLITARIVLGHQAGLPNWPWGGPHAWENGRETKLIAEPGNEFHYSGEAFNYLGRVIEKITGKSIEMLYEQEIANQFEIKDSYFNYHEHLKNRMTLGHRQIYPEFKEREWRSSPASSFLTNAHLFKGFILALMNEKVLNKNSYELIYKPYTILNAEQRIYDPELPQFISQGFFVQDTPDGKLLAHGGNNGDFDSKFGYNPDKKFAYIAFANSNLGDEFIRALEVFLLRNE